MKSFLSVLLSMESKISHFIQYMLNKTKNSTKILYITYPELHADHLGYLSEQQLKERYNFLIIPLLQVKGKVYFLTTRVNSGFSSGTQVT